MRKTLAVFAILTAGACSRPEPPRETPPSDAAATEAADTRGLVDLVKTAATEESMPGPKGPITVSDVTFTPPEAWTSKLPSSQMRAAQYEIPGSGGDAELVIFFFGAGQGGSPDDNVDRWFGQLQGPDGGPVTDRSRESFELDGLKLTVVEAKGTFFSGMPGGPTTPRPDYALYGVIVESPRGPVFLKATGPAATLEEARDQLEAFARSAELASASTE